jgi:hypothetical protein
MQTRCRTTALVGLSCLVLAVTTASRAATPATAPAAFDAAVDADFFPILPWNFLPQPENRGKADRQIEGIAQCGFTVAGFVQPDDLPACERLGLKAIMGPPKVSPSPFARGGWKNLSDDDIDRYVRELVESSRHSPAVIGYYIVDEPGAPAFGALGKAVAAVRRHAPGKLAYINLFPGYATIGAPDQSQLGTASFTEYLERFVAEVRPQFISYDNYMVQYSDDLRNAPQTDRYFRDLLEVRRVANKHGLPFWNIVSSNQIRPVTPPPSPANLALQAWTTLAAGGRGVSWYTYLSRGYGYAPIDAGGARTETWDYLRAINRQLQVIGPMMNRLASTGVYFAGPAPIENAPTLPGRLVKSVVATVSLRQKAVEQVPIMVGEFAGGDGDYVVFVNLSLAASVNIKPELVTAGAEMHVVSAAEAKPAPLDSATKGHWLTPGQGVLVRLALPNPPRP